MKSDLATSIAVAIFGVVAAYFICNLFAGEAENYSFTTVDSASASVELKEPNPEVFNYKALNPTVEVYVGNCTNTDENGECIDESASQVDPSTLEEDVFEEDFTEEPTSSTQREE